MGQSRRDEAGLFERATAAAIEDPDALSTGGLAAPWIDVLQQRADFGAGGRGGHHKEGEGHPRQASAVATQRGETAGAAVQLPPPRRLGWRTHLPTASCSSSSASSRRLGG